MKIKAKKKPKPENYKTIAAILRQLHDSPDITPLQASRVRLAALQLSHAFAQDNVRFDRVRFLNAAWGADWPPARSY